MMNFHYIAENKIKVKQVIWIMLGDTIVMSCYLKGVSNVTYRVKLIFFITDT